MEKVEIVVQALALGDLETRAPAGLVMPRTERRTRLHRREDMHQTRPIPAPLDQLGNAILLAEVSFGNELHFHSGGAGQRHGVIPQRVPQRFGELAQIKATNVGRVKLPLQCGRMTCVHQTAGDDDTVKTTQLSGNLSSVTRNQ